MKNLFVLCTLTAIVRDFSNVFSNQLFNTISRLLHNLRYSLRCTKHQMLTGRPSLRRKF
jgi:hypothetical protein